MTNIPYTTTNSVIADNAAPKPRIEFIDLAKGVCIILVVLFHAQILTPSTPLLGALRMPLYFFLSGLFFKSYGGIINLSVKKLNKIIIPFFFFYLVGEVAFVCIIHGFGEPISQTYHHNPFLPLWEGAPHNYPIWFLVCLFWSNVTFAFLCNTFRKTPFLLTAVALLAICGIVMSNCGIEGPMWTGAMLTSLPFFCMGYFARRGPWLYGNWHPRLSLPIGIALILLALGFSYLSDNSYLSLAHNQVVGNAAMAYITSALVVPGVLLLCKGIGKLPVVSYLGRYSIIVLGLHMVLMSPIRVALRSSDPMLCNVVSGISALLLCLIAIPVCIRLVPRFTAQKPLFPETSFRLPEFLGRGKTPS